MFYVPTRNQHLIHSSVPTSHGFQPSPQEEPDRAAPDGQPQPNRFVELFKWVATIDQTPYLCVPAALQFRRSICGGEEAILQYAHDLAQNGGQAAASILGTEMMDNNSHTLSRCCFATIRLPIAFVSENDCGRRDEGDKDIQYEPTEGPKLVTEIMNRCLKDFNTWIPGKFYAGQAWVRLSAQTYLAQADFEWAARVLKDICADLRKPRWTAAATT